VIILDSLQSLKVWDNTVGGNAELLYSVSTIAAKLFFTISYLAMRLSG
jgi:hypothetical protein